MRAAKTSNSGFKKGGLRSAQLDLRPLGAFEWAFVVPKVASETDPKFGD